jgi:23S rRNA (cytosine1962-C5)-methyltransferase
LDPFKVNRQVRISRSAARRIRRGHLWVYAGEMELEPVGKEPVLVQVMDPPGNTLGHAFYSRRSQIRLRFFSRYSDPPSMELLQTRIKHSIARRHGLLDKDSACRLIFGEADLLPGVILDRYGDYLVLQTLTKGADILKSKLVETLMAELAPSGILQRNDSKARRLEGLDKVNSVLWGSVPEELEIVEGDIRFIVDLLRGQKTGFFLDQRQNRMAARQYASGRALDCFTNTGAFALQMAAKCESVLAVDVSMDSLRLAARNRDLNGFRNVDFVAQNVFDLMRELETRGQSFDTICLDPPAFAKNRKALPGARSGYKEINLRALKLLKPGGILVTSSCSYHLSESDFSDLLRDAARDCHRFVQVIEQRSQANDHPALASMPETRYLKCFILRVL